MVLKRKTGSSGRSFLITPATLGSSIYVFHHHIAEDKVWLNLAEEFQALLAAESRENFIPAGFQDSLDGNADGRVIIYYQDFGFIWHWFLLKFLEIFITYWIDFIK
jgi:sulfite reductase beta subunit-like hemoprotein